MREGWFGDDYIVLFGERAPALQTAYGNLVRATEIRLLGRKLTPMRVLFLDVDGVLNRTGFRPGESVGLRSWIEPELARRLCEVLEATGAEVVLISDWRCGRELPHLREELAAAGIVCSLRGTTPVLGSARWQEIDAWMREHDVSMESVVIVDDGFDMGPLRPRFVRTSPLNGLDEHAACEIRRLFEGEHRAAAPCTRPTASES